MYRSIERRFTLTFEVFDKEMFDEARSAIGPLRRFGEVLLECGAQAERRPGDGATFVVDIGVFNGVHWENMRQEGMLADEVEELRRNLLECGVELVDGPTPAPEVPAVKWTGPDIVDGVIDPGSFRNYLREIGFTEEAIRTAIAELDGVGHA